MNPEDSELFLRWPPNHPDDASRACTMQSLLESVQIILRQSIPAYRKRFHTLLSGADPSIMDISLVPDSNLQHGYSIALQLTFEIQRQISDMVFSEEYSSWTLHEEIIAEAINAMDEVSRMTLADALVSEEIDRLNGAQEVDMHQLQAFHELIRLGNLLNV